MEDAEFDTALIGAAFALAGRDGWAKLSVARAAGEAGLPLPRARARFPSRLAVLARFGVIADQAALSEAPPDGAVRDRLFDMIMRRMDVLQAHRAGVAALLRYLPTDPPLALALGLATRRSMRWLLEAAGVSSRGVGGELRVKGLVAVWLWAVRAWQTDESADLSATMAALDKALHRAEQAAASLGRGGPSSEEEPPAPEAAEATDLPVAPFDAPPDPPPSPPAVL